MSNCSNHKKDVAGIEDMKVLAEMIGDLHYAALATLFQNLYRKIEADARKDNDAGREKLASALQYAGMGIFESALRLEKVFEICEPFMRPSAPPPLPLSDGLGQEKELVGNDPLVWAMSELRNLPSKFEMEIERVAGLLAAIRTKRDSGEGRCVCDRADQHPSPKVDEPEHGEEKRPHSPLNIPDAVFKEASANAYLSPEVVYDRGTSDAYIEGFCTANARFGDQQPTPSPQTAEGHASGPRMRVMSVDPETRRLIIAPADVPEPPQMAEGEIMDSEEFYCYETDTQDNRVCQKQCGACAELGRLKIIHYGARVDIAYLEEKVRLLQDELERTKKSWTFLVDELEEKLRQETEKNKTLQEWHDSHL